MTAAVSEIARIKGVLSSRLQISKQNLNTSKTGMERLRAEYNIGNLSERALRGSERSLLKNIDHARAEITQLQSLVEVKSSNQVAVEEEKKEGILPRWALALTIIMPLLILGSFTSWWIWDQQGHEKTTETQPPEQTTAPTSAPPKNPADLTEIIANASRSVVRILTMEGSYSNGYRYGVGCGIIIDHDGYILTCNHVVENAQSIKIALPEGKQYEAKVIKPLPSADLAIVAISSDYASPRSLPVAILGDSDVLQDGEDVIAIGYPPLLEEHVDEWLSSDSKKTKGIVSGKSTYKGIPLIQTDAPVSAGNSGGPLINTRGEVVGIISFVITGERIQNANFAIAIDYAKQFIKETIGE